LRGPGNGWLLPRIDTVTNFPDKYFNGLVGVTVDVECQSWPDNFARTEWGPSFQEKTTSGVILDVKLNRKTRKPFFTIHSAEIDQTVVKLDLDYVLKYSNELPGKYNFLKADYILRLSAMASIPDATEFLGKNSEDAQMSKQRKFQ
jgi:hypothetical protein